MSLETEFDVTGTIARLFIYPVKSCAGIEVQEAVLTETGLDLDRAWMVVDAQGHFLTQRTLPRMALIRPQLKSSEMVLRAPGMLALHVALDLVEGPATVTVWDDTVPAWDLRLSSKKWTGDLDAHTQFADGFAVLVTSEASIDDLNERLVAKGHEAVGVERFRPNVVLGGVDAHDEDRIDGVHIAVGQGDEADTAELRHVKPCARCPIPNIDPATAQSSPAVSDTLSTYRSDKRLDGAITFGMNAVVARGAGQVLRVGQRFGAHYCFD